MQKTKEMFKDWDCVMIFDPADTEKETFDQFSQYLINNHSAVGDRNIPNAAQTRKYLSGY